MEVRWTYYTIQIQHHAADKGNAAFHIQYIAAPTATVAALIKNITITSYFFQLDSGTKCPIKSK